jgi:hypothetical protein
MAEEMETTWVISNRQDDRVVLFERDPAHPGGEAFVGGAGPDFVAKTPEVEAALRRGEMVEIPEPPDSRKKPLVGDAAVSMGAPPDMPGQSVRLGRQMDPELVPEGALKRVERQQEEAPKEVPVPSGVVMPPEPAPERETRRR